MSDAELFISPVMKEDSDCFRTVSFHILRIRLWMKKKEKEIKSPHSEPSHKSLFFFVSVIQVYMRLSFLASGKHSFHKLSVQEHENIRS